MKAAFVSLLIASLGFWASAQTLLTGANGYTEYHVGTLPIILSVPHGGDLTPTSIPDRTCNSPVTVTDGNTLQLGHLIDTAFVNLLGCHPHLICCNLKRTKIDCNRNLADGACGNPEAEVAWNEFHDWIDSAQTLAQNAWGAGNALYIDLHGHGHTVQRLELGYLLYGSELVYTDSVLNTPTYVNLSSLQCLVPTNLNGYTHAELLRGNHALGTYLETAGYPSVPSLAQPDPDTLPYFSGGYNTINYTCNVSASSVPGLQIECNYTGVRDTYANRKAFADSLAAVVVRYMRHHMGLEFAGCAVSSEPSVVEAFSVYPTLISSGETLHIKGMKRLKWSLFSVTGINCGQGESEDEIRLPNGLAPGIYLLSVGDDTADHHVKLRVQ
jgi:hypothetical protein